MKELSDEKLMGLVKQGKLNFMELLFMRYQKQLFNYFLKCTLDRDDSQDLTQNTFVRVMKYRNSFNVGKGFRIWLFQIARNQVKDYYAGRDSNLEQLSEPDELVVTDNPQLDEEQRQEDEKLHKALAMLPHDKRELLVMSKFQGLKYDEIARIRDTNVNAIKVQVHRTIAQLRNIYFEELQ